MADRLDSLVEGRIARSYLPAYGWWARLVLERFAFLEERGYALDEVHFHQQGNFIRYSGPRLDVYLDYEPESTRSFSADLFDRDAERFIPIDKLIRDRDATVEFPPRDVLDPASVSENVRFWASALNAMADEVL